MQTIQIDGLKFDGPYVLGRDELPNVPAIALKITEAGEGFKIMSVLHGVNIKEEIENSPKQDCWHKHAYHDIIDIYLNLDDMPESKREDYRIRCIEKRKDVIFCDEVTKIVDDW